MRSTEPTITIRTGAADDLPGIRRVLTDANGPFRSVLPAGAYVPYLNMVLDLEARLGQAKLIVAESQGRLVGAVTYYPDATQEGWGCPAGYAGIRSMGVAPGAQRSGVGTALLDECRRRALLAGAGAVGIVLHTASFLPAAIRLYEQHGFVRDPEHDTRAAELMKLASPTFDYQVLAYRLDLPR